MNLRMRVSILLIGLPWMLLVSGIGAQESTQSDQPKELNAKVYKDFDLGQKALLAGAAVFKPESAQKANVMYFHQNAQVDPQKVANVGFRLENGTVLVVNSKQTGISDLAAESHQ